MSENCNKECGSCHENCSERKTDFSEKPHELSNIKKVIGIVSGKGGVGKSLVTSMLAVAMRKKGYKTAILDADVTGPSIPKAFGLKERAMRSEQGMFPVKSSSGINVMSINLILPNETDPVIWRGPMIGNMVKQFWTDVIWGDVDYMFIDMPPGTGDVPLTVFQSLAVDGIIVVTSPQELVSMIVAKAVKMAEMMNIPVIGLVENMSYFKCPDNGKEYKIFGESHIDDIAKQHGLKMLVRLPIDPKIAEACDQGKIESLEMNLFESVTPTLENLENKKMKKIAVANDHGTVAGHFGHCEGFMIFETDGKTILNTETVPNPGHRPGFLPNFLNDMGVNVIIAGGMGGGAVAIFNEKKIEIVVGASGDSKAAVEQFLHGSLKSTGSVCNEHQHHGSCGH